MAGKLRVLVVDDSSYNRQAICEILNSHADIEVADTAEDGEKALKIASQIKPDLITLDLEMPRMDGFTFLRLLMNQMPTPVIVVSSHSRKQEVFQALELGALDFIAKPSHFFNAGHPRLRRDLIDRALAVRDLQILPLSRRASKKAEPRGEAPEPPTDAAPSEPETVQRLVCVGASTGGPPALQSLLRAMGSGKAVSYLITQHMPEKFTRAFAERLDRHTGLAVAEATEGELLAAGKVFIAPGGAHMEVCASAEGPRIRLVAPMDEDTYVPSIDRLFASAARYFEGPVLGAILTGMGSDGAAGIAAMHAAGGVTLAESKETAIVYGMPKGAAETGYVNEVLPLDRLIARIHEFTMATDSRRSLETDHGGV